MFIVIEIIYNLAILVAFSVLSGFIDKRIKRENLKGQVLQGILFGTAALIGMLYPFVLSEGIIFDGRSVVLSLAALFFGPVSGLIAALMAAMLRIYIGGGGVYMGVSVIASSVLIGVFFHYFVRRRAKDITPTFLYGVGIIVHLVMIMLMTALPSNFRLVTLQTIGITIILFYPIATVIIGKVLKDQYDNNILLDELAAREEKYRLLAENSADFIWMTDLNFNVIFASPAVTKIFGYSIREYLKLPVNKTITEDSFKKLMQIFAEELEVEKNDNKDLNRIRIVENKEITKYGNVITTEARISFVRNSVSSPIGIIGVTRDISDRVAAVDALRKSEEDVRFLIENQNELVVKVDSQNRFVYVSQSYCKLFGKTQEELLGKTFVALIHEADRDNTMKEMEKLAYPPHTCFIEQRAMTAMGWRWLAWSDKAILNDDGKIEFVIGVGRDITEKFQAELQLRKSEALFKSIVENIPFHFWQIDKDKKFVFQNRMSQDLFGNLKSISLDNIHLNPNIKRKWIEFANIALLGETIEETETLLITGKRYDFNMIIAPIITGFDISGVMFFFFDISEKVAQKAALEHSEEKFKKFIENIGKNYFIYQENTDHRFTYISPSVYDMLGYNPNELIGKPNYADTLSDSFINEEVIKRSKSGYKGDISEPFMAEFVHKNGSNVLVEITEMPVYDYLGRVVLLDGIARDVTREKQVEEAIKKQVLALTMPLDDSSDITFSDLFNLDEIQKLQDQFANTTNVASMITYPNGEPITRPSNFCRLCKDIIRTTEVGKFNCKLSDSIIGGSNRDCATIQRCLSGELWDAGASIVVGGKHIANWLIGQVRNEDTDLEELVKYADKIGADRDEFRKALEEVPVMSLEQFNRIADMLYTIASELSLKAYQNVQQARFISESEKVKNELKASERKYRLLFENITAGFALHEMIYDKVGNPIDYRYLEVNPAFENLTGSKINDLIGKTVKQVMPNTEQYWIDTYGKVAKTGEPLLYQYFAQEIGKYFDVWAFSPDKDRFAVIFTDITYRRKAEDALKMNKERLDAAMNAARAGLWDWNLKYDDIFFDTRYYTMAGYSPNEFFHSFEEWENRVHPDDIDLCKETIHNYLKGFLETFTMEFRFRRKDGSYMWIRGYGKAVEVDKNNDIVRIIGLHIDISEQKQIEKALKLSEEKFRTLFDTMPNGYYRTTSQGYFVDANPALVAMLGYDSIDELLSVHIPTSLYVTEKEREEINEINTEFVNQIETYRLKRKDGSIIWIEDNARYILNDEGEVIFHEGICKDVTERKLWEEKIRKLNADLEDMVELRTEELQTALNDLQITNFELQILNERMNGESQKIHKLNEELNQALASKDKFFSIIAHDLKNPFVALLNNSDLLLNYYDKMDEVKIKSLIKSMQEASQITYTLLDNLLLWSRSQMGRMEVKPHFVNMKELVYKSILIHQSQAQIKDITIESKLADDTFSYCDSEMVLTVIRNLISNAIKFTQIGGSVEIGLSDITLYSENNNIKFFDDSKPMKVFYIKDNGIGIPTSRISKIFSVGNYKGTKGTSFEPGTGLGLIICKEFIEHHGGKIWAESAESVGTTFFFSLP